MRIIKMLAEGISENIEEAREKIEEAYRLKSLHPAESMWLREMALAHLNFNARGHELVAAQIAAYKASQEYKDHPEYADGMMAVWNDKHADMMARSARVKAMIDGLK